jgi:hypothetical protein
LILEKLVKDGSIPLIFDSNSLLPKVTPGILSEYLEQLKTLDQSKEGIFITGFYALMALLSLLRINDRDREFWQLPDQLAFLYYAIRPIRLLVQYPLGMLHFITKLPKINSRKICASPVKND